jgi:hypothetical protein
MSIVPESVTELMASPEERLDRMLSTFENAHDTDTWTPGKNLRSLLAQSPELQARFLDSIADGNLKSFEALPAKAHAGGSYNGDSKTMRLPLPRLGRTETEPAMAAELTFVLGHELEHSFFRTSADQADTAFKQEILAIAMGPGPHDYTDAVKQLFDSHRENEARAHIGGFNALASQVKSDNPDAGLRELYEASPGRMEDFIDRSGRAPDFDYALKPGLTLSSDGTLKPTPQNIEAMGRYFFDQPPSAVRLGTNGNQDYINYYGEGVLASIERAEKAALVYATAFDPGAVPAEIRLDMDALGLKPALLTTDLTFLGNAALTASTQSVPEAPIAAPDADAPAIPAPGENALYAQALRSIDGVAGQLGLSDRGETANLAAATALEAMQAGMHRVDGVVVGVSGRIYVYEGDPSSASVNRAAVDVDRAKLTPANDSLDAMASQMPSPVQQVPMQQQGLRM